MQTEVLQAMQERRSCRAYLPQQVGAEELEAVLTAGTWAPTGMGAQSPVIVAVQDRETRDTLSRLNAAVMGGDKDPFYGAPTVLVVLADKSRHTCVEDGSLVMGNLLLAAHAAGLGACWIHRARKVFATEEGKALLRKWGVGENYAAIAHCILGYPAETPTAKPRKEDFILRV